MFFFPFRLKYAYFKTVTVAVGLALDDRLREVPSIGLSGVIGGLVPVRPGGSPTPSSQPGRPGRPSCGGDLGRFLARPRRFPRGSGDVAGAPLAAACLR